VKPSPGFETPPLRHGALIHLSQVRVRSLKEGIFTLEPLGGGQTQMLPVASPGANVGGMSFLPPGRYTEDVRDAVDEIAYRLFGFPNMKLFQHKILERVLTGRPVLGIAATGGGKSECFILPAMLFPGITVVVSPLKSLMADQFQQRIRRRYGLDHLTTTFNGDTTFKERQARLRRLELGYYKLAYFTPEQLERGWVLGDWCFLKGQASFESRQR